MESMDPFMDSMESMPSIHGVHGFHGSMESRDSMESMESMDSIDPWNPWIPWIHGAHGIHRFNGWVDLFGVDARARTEGCEHCAHTELALLARAPNMNIPIGSDIGATLSGRTPVS